MVAGDDHHMVADAHPFADMDRRIEVDKAGRVNEGVRPDVQPGIDIAVAPQVQRPGDIDFARNMAESAGPVNGAAHVAKQAVGDAVLEHLRRSQAQMEYESL